ncbi:MAG: DUF2062 domain-containing protein [Planctomycetota bacterium]|jgi:uncharacterized protein (TIGR03546 family)
MILPKFIRKILAILRGGVSPVIVTLSVALGFWFGIIPGWSGFHTAIIIVMLVLNIHTGLFLLSAAIGKAVCFAAAPVLFHIGVFVHDYLHGLLSLPASAPVIGMTDFSRYAVAGAVVTGPVVGIVGGLLMARVVIGFRRTLLKFEDGSEKFRKWYSNRWVRILDRLLIGKRTKDAKSLFSAKSKIIRKAGVALAVIVLAISAAVVILLGDARVKDYAARTMTRANGAEVNLGSLDLSLLTGGLSLADVQVTDPEKPQNNQVSIEKITADASLYNLLLGKVVMDMVEVSGIKFDQPREAPGKLEEAGREEQPSVFEPNDFEVGVDDIRKLDNYFKNAKAIKQWLLKARKWLPAGKEKPAAGAKEVPAKYLDYLKAKSAAPPSPRLLARQVLLDELRMPLELFGNSRVVLQNISDSARAAGLPVVVEMKSYDTPALMNIKFDYSSPGRTPEVTGTFEGFDLRKALSGISADSGLVFEAGTASGRFDGTLTEESVNLTINVAVREMKARSQGKGILGLGGEATSEAFKVLEKLNATIRVVGPVGEPRLAFEAAGLREQLKEALVKAGKDRLANEIDKQIDKELGDKVPDEIKDALKKPGGLLDGLGGILKGKDEKKQE